MRFNGPQLEAVRTKFYWWPRRVVVFKSKFYASGQPKVPYIQGWYHTMAGYPGMNLTARGRGNKPPAAAPGQGMVTPVEQRTVASMNAWVWLDWVFEEYNISNSGDFARASWRPTRIKKQWNLWHEYD